MTKISVTYTDIGGDAPRVISNGITFVDGKPVEFVAEKLGPKMAFLVQKWRDNPWFEVKGAESIKPPAPPVAPTVDLRDIDDADKQELAERNAAAAQLQLQQVTRQTIPPVPAASVSAPIKPAV